MLTQNLIIIFVAHHILSNKLTQMITRITLFILNTPYYMTKNIRSRLRRTPHIEWSFENENNERVVLLRYLQAEIHL